MTAPNFTITDEDNDPSKALALPAKQQARITKCRAYLDGLDAVRERGDDSLPKLEGESAERYTVRSKYGALHPSPEQFVDAVAGMILQTEITFESDMPSQGVDFWEDVDGTGKGGVEYSEEIIRDALCDGIAGTFTDMPRADAVGIDRSGASAAAVPGATLDAADGAALGLRPYWVQVRAGDYKETWGKIKGQRVLTKFVRREVVKAPVGLFGERCVTQYRVYRRDLRNTVTCELWQEPDGGGRPTVVANSLVTLQNCAEIKWSPLKCGTLLRDGTRKPPVETLIDQALVYYQVQNGMMSVSFESFVATIVRVGAMPEKTEVLPDGTVKLTFPPMLKGSGETIEMPPLEPGSAVEPRVFYLQPNSDVLVPADKMLDRVEGLINMIVGAFFGLDTLGVESGVAKKQKARGGNAAITKFARAYKQMLELSYQHWAGFLGVKAGGINVKLQFDEVELTAQEMTAIGGYIDRGLSIEDAVAVLIARGFFGPHPDRTGIIQRWEDNQAAVAAQKEFDAQLKTDALNSGNATTDELGVAA